MLKKAIQIMLLIVCSFIMVGTLSCNEQTTNNQTYSITYILDGKVKIIEPSTYQTDEKIVLPTFIDDDFSGWYTKADYSGGMVLSFTNQIGDKVFYGYTTNPEGDNGGSSSGGNTGGNTGDNTGGNTGGNTDVPVIENPTENTELANIISNISFYEYTFDYADGDEEYDYTYSYAYSYDNDYEYYSTTYEYYGTEYTDYYIFDLDSESYSIVTLNEDETGYEKYSSDEYDLDDYISNFDFVYPEGIDASLFVKDGNTYHLITSALTAQCNSLLCFDEWDEETFISFDLYVENNQISKIVIKSKVQSSSYGNYNPVYTITFKYTNQAVEIPSVTD